MAFRSQPTQAVDEYASAVALGVWIRNRRRTRAWAAVAALWSLAFAALPFISGDLGGNRTLGDAVALAVFYCGPAVLGLALAGRVAIAGLWIGRNRIVVRGPFRTRSVAIADVGLFEPGLQGRGGNGTPCPMLERHERRAIGVWALGRRNIWFRYERLCAEIQPLCDELNELLGALRSAALSPEHHA